MNDDEKFLRKLSEYHYLLGGLLLLLFLAFISFMAWNGISSVADGDTGGALAIFIPVIFLSLLALIPLCMLLAGRSLAQRRNYHFIFKVACVECISFPFGTALGVITLTTLQRKTVKEIFNSHSPVPPPVPGAKTKEWDY